MKKLLLSIITVTAFGFGANAQIVNIPDANFKAYLVGNTLINTNADTEIQVSEANSFTGDIYCQNSSISDLTGIEAFTSLTELVCSGNQLTVLDVTNNTALDLLSCGNNQLTVLNVTNNTALDYLSCGNNQLTVLDVTNNTALYSFTCSGNQLTSLDLTNNTVLDYLYFNNNSLTSLDLTNNTALTKLSCWNNSLTSLDITNNTALTDLSCVGNQLTTLDVSQHTVLTIVHCSNNSLTTLNVANGNNGNFTYFGAGSNPNLTCIQVDYVPYSTSNWTNVDAGVSFSTNCGSVGINERANNIDITIYPNPTNSQLTISTIEKVESINIIDIAGKTVKTLTENTNIIDVSNLPNGIYFLQVQTDNGIVTSKFIKE